MSFPCEILNLVLVGIEDILLATTKVRVDLAREKGVLRDVRVPRILIQGKQKKPGNANHDT